MTATTSNHFIDSALARLIALVLAGLVAYLLYSQWGAEITGLLEGRPIDPLEAKAPASEPNPALDECIAQRVGDVERMKSEGIINEAQYESFGARAVNLCNVQNPQP